MRAWGLVTNATAHALASWLCALWGLPKGARSGAPLASLRGVWGALPLPQPPVLGSCGQGPQLTGYGCGVPVWQPALSTGRTSLRPLRSFAGAVFLGPFSRAVVQCLLCVLPGSVSPGDCCCLARVCVPWLWPAMGRCGVPHGRALVRRALSGLVALGALVGFRVALLPSPTGGFGRGFPWRLRGARGGLRTRRLMMPAAGPCRARETGLPPRPTFSGPSYGVVPGGSFQR